MKILPKVPVVFKGRFPKNFVNDVKGWGFSQAELNDNLGKLLTLDIDFGTFCSLNCPHCFRRNNQVDFGEQRLMTFEDSVKLIKDAKKLGLRSVKFLGAGEPFQNKRFIEFLRFLHSVDVIPLIFTKGHVIGDDAEVAKWHEHMGITTGDQLVKEIKRLNCSILLGFNSFDTDIQDKMVGNIPGYTLKRNRALELLVKHGLNKTNPTRIAFIATPITTKNYAELYELYSWARVRNFHCITCPTMVSGRCGNEDAWKKITPPVKDLVALYTKVYQFNLRKGIHTREQIRQEGIASYAGCRPCNQCACGMYVTLTGTVLRCPGDDITVFGSIWKDSLKNIWINSENYGRAGMFNNGCPPKYGKSIPFNLYTDVKKKVLGK